MRNPLTQRGQGRVDLAPRTAARRRVLRPRAGRKFFEGIGAAWDSLALDIESVDEAGANLVGVLRADGTLKGGESRSYGAVHLFEIGNGKIRRFREYVNLLS